MLISGISGNKDTHTVIDLLVVGQQAMLAGCMQVAPNTIDLCCRICCLHATIGIQRMGHLQGGTGQFPAGMTDVLQDSGGYYLLFDAIFLGHSDKVVKPAADGF